MHILAWCVLIFWIMAFLRVLLNLASLRRLSSDAPDDGPAVSIVIPARNEERSIERTVRAFLAQSYRNLEIIVVDDRSTDGTSAILNRLSATDSRLHVISGVEPAAGWLGKLWALDQGSRAASGEILLFVDADIFYAPRAVAAAVAALRDLDVPMIAVLPRIEMVGFWENVAMPMLAFFLFAGFPMWLANRSRIAILGVGGGTGNMILRSTFEACGGFEPLKAAVVDDVGLARWVRRNGYHTRVVMADDLISVRIYHGAREIIVGFTKNIFHVMNRSYATAAVMMVLLVLIHLFPYAMAIAGSGVALANVIIISALRVALFSALGYRLDNAVFLHPLMVLFWAYIQVRSVWITGVLKQVHWRGRVYQPSR